MAIFQKQKKETPRVVATDDTSTVGKDSPYAKIVLRPRITEKATGLSASSRIYSFTVSSSANKHMVKKTIEAMHRVHVTSVRIVNIPRKRRMRGKLEGWKKGYKKALVKVKEGQIIEIVEEVKKK